MLLLTILVTLYHCAPPPTETSKDFLFEHGFKALSLTARKAQKSMVIRAEVHTDRMLASGSALERKEGIQWSLRGRKREEVQWRMAALPSSEGAARSPLAQWIWPTIPQTD